MRAPVPVYVPHVPALDAVLPYLREIDESRWYTNFGPLVRRLERRLLEHFGIPEGGVTTVANGTLGLVLALRALGAEPNSFCLVPSWTFAATAHAVCAAGLTPYFVDVDRESWAISPEAASAAIREAPGKVGAVVPVAPFGAPVNAESWDDFADETGLSVAVDAAAGFDGLRPGRTPAVVSLHATKVFGIGEGGLVISTDERLTATVRTLSNFGFAGTREARVVAFNAKLDEYAAAVGLAAFDQWPETRAAYAALSAGYAEALTALSGVRLSPGFGAGWVSSTCNVMVDDVDAQAVANTLDERGIETRKWWGRGCHAQPAFAAFPRGALDVTEQLGAAVLGLPFHLGVGEAERAAVAEALAAALAAPTHGAGAS